MNLQHTYVRGVLATTAPDDADVRERVARGVRVNRAPEMALALPPVPVCPHCYQNVYHLERPVHATLSIAVRCGDCGWTGRAVVGRY